VVVCEKHSKYPVVFGTEGSLLSLCARLLPTWTLGEEVCGFAKATGSADKNSPIQTFEERLREIRRPDGRNHVAGFAAMQLSPTPFMDSSRSRTADARRVGCESSMSALQYTVWDIARCCIDICQHLAKLGSVPYNSVYVHCVVDVLLENAT
jgi:hypothetical protein